MRAFKIEETQRKYKEKEPTFKLRKIARGLLFNSFIASFLVFFPALVLEHFRIFKNFHLL